MKKPIVAILLSGLLAVSVSAQSPGFGASAAAGPSFQGGDAAQITQRIMSATRYRLTPGDVYQLAITAESNTNYPLVLQENYDIDIPWMGTKNVKGMYFADLRTMITQGIKKLLPLAQFVSLTLQSPARFDVAVFGGVQSPGTVTVYSLARVSDAIILAGRFKAGGSYRQISLIRGDQKISVDLQGYSADAASEENPYLAPGDKIYVPQAQITVTLAGEVKYPGPFEMIPGESLATLIGYAGGTLPDARSTSVEIIRFKQEGTTSQTIVDLATASNVKLADGDRVRVPALTENRDMILVTGAVFGAPVASDKPVQIPALPLSVNVPYTPGLSLLTVLEALGGPTPYANAKESLVQRKAGGERLIVDVDALWSKRDLSKDLVLQPGDTVTIPMVTEVFVAGEVRTPGKITYNPSLLVSDYLVASGGVNPDTADMNGIFFVDKTGGKTKVTLTTPVPPGSVIVVSQNAWTQTQKNFTNITIVTGFVATILTFMSTLIDFIRIFIPAA